MNLCGFEITDRSPFFLIAGTCVIESAEMAKETAGRLKEICNDLDIHLIYKLSLIHI